MLHILGRGNLLKQHVVCLLSRRGFVKVGDAVPVSYLKEEKPPLIKEDKEYPEWLSSIGKKLPNKQELLAKFAQDDKGAANLTVEEARRLKRLITLEQIKTYNLSQVAEKSG